MGHAALPWQGSNRALGHLRAQFASHGRRAWILRVPTGSGTPYKSKPIRTAGFPCIAAGLYPQASKISLNMFELIYKAVRLLPDPSLRWCQRWASRSSTGDFRPNQAERMMSRSDGGPKRILSRTACCMDGGSCRFVGARVAPFITRRRMSAVIVLHPSTAHVYALPLSSTLGICSFF